MSTDPSRCAGCVIAGSVSQREFVSRREFVSQATLAAVTLALTACGGGALDQSTGPAGAPVPPVVTTPFVITPANFPALAAVGGAARVSSQPPIALARIAPGPAGLVGYSLECTHAGTTVDLRDDFTLRCPNHGAEFAFDGAYTGGTQRTSSLFRVTVTPDATGATVAITS
jgi:Rieske Fe-S protein